MRRLTTLALALLVLSVASCGGDDDGGNGTNAGSSATTEQDSGLSKQEFIEKADRACAEYDEVEAQLEDRIENATSEEDQAETIRDLADAAEETGEKIEDLGPPDEGADLVERYIEKGREQILLMRRAADELASGDSAGARAIVDSAQDQGAELRGLAQGYGFQECGNND